MKQPKLKVTADQYNEMKEDMPSFMGDNVIPVGYRGRQIFPVKNNPNNLSDAQDDIREYYGLTNTYGVSEGE